MSESPDFFDLLRSFERELVNFPRIGESSSRAEDIVYLGQEPHVDFSRHNVRAIVSTRDSKPYVISRFLGLLGPQGALPLHTAYETTHWLNMRDPAFAHFLDIFNNRFLQLFYRTWANCRPLVQADRPANNQFRAYIGAMIGIATPATQGRDSLHDDTKLAAAGLLAPTVKSAARLADYLVWLFKAKVKVEQFTGIWLKLEEQELTLLHKGKARLGNDTLLGRSAYSVSDKFRVRIAAGSLGEFEDFLPTGRYFQSLADAVAFYVGDTYVYDVALGLPQAEARPMQLGRAGRLGWTGWLGNLGSASDNNMRWDCKFHPAELANN